MTDPRDPLTRLEAADPLAGVDTADAAAALRHRVVTTHAAAPVHRTWTRRRLAPAGAVAALTAVALAVVGLGPADREGVGARAGLPAPITAFAETLRQAEVLHVRAVATGTVDATGRFTPAERAEHTEGWYATDGSASRTRYTDASGELQAEGLRRDGEVYVFNRRQGLLQRYREERTAGSRGAWLLRLRKGVAAPGVRVAGRATVRGIPAYELAYDAIAGDATPEDHRAFIAIDGGALLRVDTLILPQPRDPAPDSPRLERLEVDDFDALRTDAGVFEPSAPFADMLDDTPAAAGP